MISLRQTSLAVAGAVLLTGLSPVYASTAKKHPKPSHPEAVHAKAQHPAPQKGTKHAAPKATRHTAKKTKGHKRGQAAIDNQRAGQIQAALVREHYLSGEPSGTWDISTQEAMRRYQAAQGWQTKQVPDSRALIRLGLGPDHGHLLNPESAMTTGPHLSQSASNAQPTGGAYSKAPVATQTGTRINPPAAAMPQISPSR
jgi:peptidoglycan hydrolase-like protein with peptidoglycan-binding domain